MPPKTNAGSKSKGSSIRARRNELGYTIDEVAKRAGVSSKTWIRYEAGESIRTDKVRGVLRALNWNDFPDSNANPTKEDPFHNANENHEAWSTQLEKEFGRATAAVFAFGSDIALDQVKEDLRCLSMKPRGTHLGELGASWLEGTLPPQFAMRYDYEFLYSLIHAMKALRRTAKAGHWIVAHTVLEELALHIIIEEGELYLELYDALDVYEEECPEGLFGELCGDEDLQIFLYDDLFLLQPGDTYHFDRWWEQQFYIK